MTEDTFGARLKAALKAKGWNQSDLVRESGLDKNTVSALVRDVARAQPATVGRIEQALGVTLDMPVASGEDSSLPEPAWRQFTEKPDFSGISDEELLAELSGRIRWYKDMLRGMAEAGPGIQDDDGDAGASVTPIRPDDGGGDTAYQPIAARRGRSQGKQLRAELDKLGEENQDTGGEEPS